MTYHKNKVDRNPKRKTMTAIVILVLRCLIFSAIVEDIDDPWDQIAKIKTTVFHSPTTVTSHFLRKNKKRARKMFI